MADETADLMRKHQMIENANHVVRFWEQRLVHDLDTLARVQARIEDSLDRLETAKSNAMRVDNLMREDRTDG